MNLTPEQESIITTKNKTMLVAASAGSGKTFVVVEKIINSIVNERKQIDSLLIVTFTNAAASELRERIVKKLQEALKSATDIGDTELAYHISKQINKAWSANISTIHSFCLSVIKDNFYILGVDPNVTTIDASRANIMLTESINEVIDEKYEEKEIAFYDILEILGSEEELVSLSQKLYEFYSHIIDKEKFKKKVLDIYDMKNISDLSETQVGMKIIYDIKSRLNLNYLELESIISKLDGYDEFLKHKEILELLKNNIKVVLDEPLYDNIRMKLDMATELPNMPRYTGSDTQTKENILNIRKKIIENIRSFSKITYKNTEEIIIDQNKMRECIEWLFQFIAKVKEVYSLKKQKKCVIDFTDYEELALMALQNDEVVERYKSKFDTIYVDEYQDTSYAQEEIISKIAKCNNCIMVGDVKQSIYGFRNAAPELFSSKYESFDEDVNNSNISQVKIILAQNFRSRKEVLCSINNIFEKIMTLEFGGARYTEKETLKYGDLYDEKDTNEYLTEINLIQSDKTSLEEELDNLTSIEHEAEEVAKRIKQLVSTFSVYDLKKKEYRKCEYKDIVILLQVASNVADKISNILNKHGIPSYSNSKASFYETGEIKLVMDFLKILNNPMEDIPLVGVMYSKIGEFTLDDMVEIRSWDKSGLMYEALIKYKEKCLDDVLTEKISKFLTLLDNFRLFSKTYDICDVIMKLYDETGIYDRALLDVDGKQKQINMDALIQIAKDFSATSNTTVYSFIQYIENIRKKESSSDGPRLIGENENVVRIMTIHHSKGLEFPVVILMNMARIFKFPDIKDRILLDSDLGIGINILDREYNITYPSIVNMAIKSNIKYKQKSELLRLLYVALTRAKEKIIIYGTVKDIEKYIDEIRIQISDGVVSQTVLQQNNSHLKNILVGLMASNSENYTINTVKIKNEEDKENVKTDLTPLGNLKNISNNLDCSIDATRLEEIKNGITLDYQFKTSKDILQKYTATSLNTKAEAAEKISIYEEVPKILKNKIDSVSFGTCVHKIMEITDLVNSTYDEILLNTKKVLEEFESSNLNEKNIAKRILEAIECLKSKNIITSKSKIEKEYEFVIKDNLHGIVEEKLEESSLIQGIIDLYIENEDRCIIVDFKTDNVKQSDELLERYLPQLAVYKRGIELSLGKTPDVYIYSFSLNELIKVDTNALLKS